MHYLFQLPAGVKRRIICAGGKRLERRWPAKFIERGVQGYEKVFSFIIDVCGVGNSIAGSCRSEEYSDHGGRAADQGSDRPEQARQVE